MLFLFTGATGSPIEARHTAPIYLILLVLAIIIGIAILFAVLIKKYNDYLKSDAYLQKEQNRLTNRNDVQKYAKLYDLSKSQASILWEVCQITKYPNIFYSLKSNIDVNELFRNAYNLLKQNSSLSPKKLEDFFETLFKIELTVAQIKTVLSSMQFPEGSIVFYISEEGEQYPFTIIKNTKDFFVVEIPSFLATSPNKPEVLVRNRFTFKTSDGLTYNFVTRIIRYEKIPDSNQINLIISHTDKLESQAHRHFKREFFQEKCLFSSIKVNEQDKDENTRYIISDKSYEGKLSNISAGGCCIQTKLPVKEKQYICVTIPNMNITENIIGIIRSTRKLPTGLFALHIQFTRISVESKNLIYTFVYKFEL